MNTKEYKTLVLLLVAISLLIAACKPEEETVSPLSAGLSELQGLVEMKQVGEDEFYSAEPDSTLEVNGQVQTGDNGKVRLDLSTGTILRVSPSSLFTLVANEEVEDGLATKLKLEFGRVFIILNGGSMEVETPSGVASVLGSHQMVEIDPVTNNVTVTCLTGLCTARNQAGEVNFTQDEKVILFVLNPETGQFLPPTVEPMSDEDYKLWLQNNPEVAEIINQAAAAFTAIAAAATEPPATNPPPTDPPPTQAPSDGSGSGGSTCTGQTEPPSGSDYFTYGGVNFSWEEQEGAAKYVLQFTLPSGQVIPFETTETNMRRFIETFEDAGSYTWSVIALDENGNVICTTESSTFTKDDTSKWLEEQKNKKDEGGAPPPPPTQPPTQPPCDPEDPECYQYIEEEAWYQIDIQSPG